MGLLNGADCRYNDKQVYVIDVSQSVEHDHPRSLEFLRMDIKNVTDFFRKKGVMTLSERKAFEFITAENTTVDREEMMEVIGKMMLEDQGDQDDVKGHDAEVDERVFRQSYIPKNLFEVVDAERDVGIIQQGGKDDLIYAKFLNVQETKPKVVKSQVVEETVEAVKEAPEAVEQSREDENDEGDEDGSESDGSEEDSDSEPGVPRGKRHEDKEAKKVTPFLNKTDPRNGSRKSKKKLENEERTRYPNLKRRGKSKSQRLKSRHYILA
jgi:RIO kinase 1